MKKNLFFALCWLSVATTASAKETTKMEEVKVTARPFRIMLEHISLQHKYNVITNRWYYVETTQNEEPKHRRTQIMWPYTEEELEIINGK